MPRRFNYTSRKRIARSDISIRVYRTGDRWMFDADLSGIRDYKLHPHARVFVEAYRSASTSWDRWDFGRVGLLIPPSIDQCSLDRFGGVDGLLFRVKVSSDGEDKGRLLAEADAIRPRLPDDPDTHGTPLIKVEAGAAGYELWRVRFDDDLPVLVINEKVPGWKELVRDTRFRAMVCCAVMRQILTRILIIDQGENLSDEDDATWADRWIKFAESLPGVSERPGIQESSPGPENLEDLEQWIDDAVNAFVARSGLLDRFLELRKQEVGE